MVDYPIKIPPGTEDLRTSGQGSGAGGARAGPFFHGTNIYTFLFEVVTQWTAMHVEIHKSEDQGATWTQQDAANDPDMEGVITATRIDGQAFFDLDVVSKIYVLYLDTSGDLRVKPFNVVKDIWEATSSAGPNPREQTVGGGNPSIQMTRRPVDVNGIEFPIAYPGPADSGFNRVYYTVYRPATDAWDTGVRLFGAVAESQHYSALARAEGPATGVNQRRVHFFAVQGEDQFQVTSRTVHKSVEGTDVINSQENVNAAADQPKVGHAKSGNEIIVSYTTETKNLKVARAVSSPSMTWLEEDVLLDEPELGPFENPTDVANFGLDPNTESVRVYFQLSDSTNDNGSLNFSDDGGTGTWGPKQTLHTFTSPPPTNISGLNVHSVGDVVGTVFNLGVITQQAHYTQEGTLGKAGMINQVDTVSGGGYVAS